MKTNACKTRYCPSCDKEERSFEYRQYVICMECGLEIAETRLTRETKLNGALTSRGKKALKRKLHLLELLERTRIAKVDTLERENVICEACGKHFVAIRINHLKYCGDCTKFKEKMADLVLKRDGGLND